MLFKTAGGRFEVETVGLSLRFLRAPVIGEVFIQRWPRGFIPTATPHALRAPFFETWRDGKANMLRVGRVEVTHNRQLNPQG